MLELDPEKLLIELSDGKSLDPELLEALLACLNTVDTSTLARLPSVDQIYSYLVVLGKLGDPEHRRVLERYLEAEDCLTVSLILETLCIEWGLTEEYLEHVLKFALQVDWDVDSDVQETAIKILGEYLNAALPKDQQVRPREYRVLELLYGLFADPTLGEWTRQVAYGALLRAMGVALEDLPSDCLVLDLAEDSSELDQVALNNCRTLLAAVPEEPATQSKKRR